MEKFDYCISNPPYQDGNKQIYTDFYLNALKIALNNSLIFPMGWQGPKNANGLNKLNNSSIKGDKQIVLIDNYYDSIFKNIGTTANIIVWKKGYNNGLDGAQKIFEYGKDPKIIKLSIEDNDDIPDDLIVLKEKLRSFWTRENYSHKVSSRNPYRINADYFKYPKKYVDIDYNLIIHYNNDNFSRMLYINSGRKFSKVNLEYLRTLKTDYNGFCNYKIFIAKAWGNMADSYIGGAYSGIVLGEKTDSCSESFVEITCKTTFERECLSKLLLTKHFRTLLFMGKTSQNSAKNTYRFVPVEDFSEDFWKKDLSITDLDVELSKKYGYKIEDYPSFEKVQDLDESSIKTFNDYNEVLLRND